MTHANATPIPTPKIEREKVSNMRLRWMSGEEEKTLLRLFRQWEKHEHADVVEVLIDTGMRPSELFAMQPRDLNLKDGSIHIMRTEKDGKVYETKNGEDRTIYMTARVYGPGLGKSGPIVGTWEEARLLAELLDMAWLHGEEGIA